MQDMQRALPICYQLTNNGSQSRSSQLAVFTSTTKLTLNPYRCTNADVIVDAPFIPKNGFCSHKPEWLVLIRPVPTRSSGGWRATSGSPSWGITCCAGSRGCSRKGGIIADGRQSSGSSRPIPTRLSSFQPREGKPSESPKPGNLRNSRRRSMTNSR